MAKPDKKKLKGFKDFDASKYINTAPTLDEAVGGTIVLTFGRMNPITVGHEKLVQKVLSVASKEKGTPKVFLTQTQDKKKNPLDYKDKIKFAQKAFGKVVEKSTAKTIIQVAQSVENFDNLVLVVGSDRVKEFDTLLNKYNGKDYNFKSIKVVSAGDRDPDADDVSGMSASKMRALAADNDILQFTKGLPKKLRSSAKAMMAAVRKGMNMTEETENLTEVLSRMQRRKRGLAMRKARFKIKRGREKAKKRTASQEVLKKRARKAAINLFKKKFSKSRRYADLSAGEKEVIDKRVSKINKKRIEQIARKLLPIVKAKERARRKAMMTGGSGTSSSSVVKESKTIKVGESSIGAESTIYAHVKDRTVLSLGNKDEMLAIAEQDGGRVWVVSSENEVGDLLEGVAQDKDVKDMPGSQPKGYFAGVDKEKKDDRERHFKRNAKKADDDASAYKPAPGDKEAKTKVSKHTKKARDMFGEDNDLWGKRQGKRPHMLLDTNGKPKFDKRFKMYRPKNEEYEEDIAEELLSLIEDTESFELELNEDPTKSLKKKSEKTGMPVGVLRSVYNRGVAAWKTGHRPGTTPEQWGHARVNSFITKSSGTWGKADKDLADKVRGSKKEEYGAGFEGTHKLVKRLKKDTPDA
jgi:nicotinic acid mononucleotide adenylyltransferase|tara:strand:- start:21053 stop:22963 length:1911 start_codon:yes stop_codon:yes gene_type:complete